MTIVTKNSKSAINYNIILLCNLVKPLDNLTTKNDDSPILVNIL